MKTEKDFSQLVDILNNYYVIGGGQFKLSISYRKDPFAYDETVDVLLMVYYEINGSEKKLSLFKEQGFDLTNEGLSDFWEQTIRDFMFYCILDDTKPMNNPDGSKTIIYCIKDILLGNYVLD